MSRLLLNDQVLDRVRQRTLTVTSSLLVNGRVRLMNEADNVEELIALDDIRKGIGKGEFHIVQKRAPRHSASDIATEDLTSALGVALRAMRCVSERAQSYSISLSQAFEAVELEHGIGALKCADDVGGENQFPTSQPFPSRATFYRYMERQRNGLPPLHGNANKGNRNPRHSAQETDLIIALAAEYFLRHGSRWNIKAITELANQQLRDIPKAKAVSRKFVQKVILTNCTRDSDAERMDPKDRSAARSIAKDRIRVEGFLQRVEQDALHVPWRFTTDSGMSTNVWLVHAICCGTSVPVGSHLVVGSPTESDGLKCVESILFSKAVLFQSMGLSIDIDPYGTPALIVFDNGPEAKGDRMRLLTQIGTDTHHLKSRRPQGKPFIERLNRSLKEDLKTLPGCTRFEETDGERDPELLGDCSMSLEEFRVWLVRWYYEKWVNQPLERLIRTRFVEEKHLGDTPAERFHNITVRDGYAFPLPPNRLAWERTKYVHDKRTLSRKTGISLDAFLFRGKNLERLIARFGEATVTVLYDPDDFRTVWVVDGDENVALSNIDTDERTPAYTFQQAKAIVQDAKSKLTEPATVAKFRRDLFARSTQTSTPKPGKATSSAEQSRQTTVAAREKEAVRRARNKPTAPSVATSAAEDQPLLLKSVRALPVFDRTTGEPA